MKNFLIPLAFRRELCKSVLQFWQSVGTLICGIGKLTFATDLCNRRKRHFESLVGLLAVGPLSNEGFFIYSLLLVRAVVLAKLPFASVGSGQLRVSQRKPRGSILIFMGDFFFSLSSLSFFLLLVFSFFLFSFKQSC